MTKDYSQVPPLITGNETTQTFFVPHPSVPATNVNVSGGATATLAIGTRTWVFTGSTSTWTLPAVAGNAGQKFTIKNRGSGVLTVQRQGSDNLYDTASVVSIAVAAGGTLRLVNDGTYWLSI